MRKAIGTLLGKSVAGAVRLRGKSGGQAMPGLVVEKFVPGYLGGMLSQLPDGVVIITGTNGKTTTTKMVVELLQANGKRVLTNPTGSNLNRGIISSVSQQASVTGRLPYDIAVFELDEAYARRFTDTVKPRWVLALNASRDQLDRFGEVDTVARLIADTMLCATEGIVVNADDKRLSRAATKVRVPVMYFGVSPGLLQFFPRDDELVAVDKKDQRSKIKDQSLAVELTGFTGDHATYRIGKDTFDATLAVTGQHNLQNAAAALALVGLILHWEVKPPKLVAQLQKVQPAFGRGQEFTLRNGSKLQLNLVKNPASFRQGLASYVRPGVATMIAINDRIADGRDMSWLWDVDFSILHEPTPVQGESLYERVLMVTGARAADMALRLQYDDVPVAKIEPNLEKALLMLSRLPGDKVIFASYTAMLALHKLLEREAGKTL